MAQKEKVRLLVTNVLGEPVKILLNQVMPPGEHNILFSTDRLTPGIYLYQLEVEGKVLVKPMSVTK